MLPSFSYTFMLIGMNFSSIASASNANCLFSGAHLAIQIQGERKTISCWLRTSKLGGGGSRGHTKTVLVCIASKNEK